MGRQFEPEDDEDDDFEYAGDELLIHAETFDRDFDQINYDGEEDDDSDDELAEHYGL